MLITGGQESFASRSDNHQRQQHQWQQNPLHETVDYNPQQIHQEPDAVQQRNLLFEESLLTLAIEQIPLHEKTGYLNAIVQCPPEIRKNEADPAVFLAFENYDVWAAARRLVNYWEWRVTLFGETLAYESIVNLPKSEKSVEMESDSVHAVREKFRRIVEDQAMVVLPETDSKGNYVIFLDRRRFHFDWETEMDLSTFLQLVLYNYTIIIRNIGTQSRRSDQGTFRDSPPILPLTPTTIPKAGRTGFVFLNIVYNFPKNLDKVAANVRDIIQEAIPMQLVRTHLLFIPMDSRFSPSFQRVTLQVHSLIRDLLGALALVVPHICRNENELVDQLVTYGIRHEMAPQSIGGFWQYLDAVGSSSNSTRSRGADSSSHDSQLTSYSATPQTITQFHSLDHSTAENTLTTLLHEKNEYYEQRILSELDGVPRNFLFEDSLVKEAIDQIPLHEKIGYLNAIVQCPPEIRKHEADPAVFLAFENYDIWAAARRLTKYWEWRVKLFGATMAYESILNIAKRDKSDEIENDSVDTMREKFRRIVEDQAMVVLPETDSEGNFVIFFDRRRFHFDWETAMDLSTFLQLVLYNYTIIIRNIGTQSRRGNQGTFRDSPPILPHTPTPIPKAGRAGFIFLTIVNNFPKSLDNVAANVRDIIQGAMPIRLVRAHLLFLPMDSRFSKSFQRVALSVHLLIRELFGGIASVVPHMCSIENELIEQLVPYGIRHEMAPQSIGGFWQYLDACSSKITSSNTRSTVTDSWSNDSQMTYYSANTQANSQFHSTGHRTEETALTTPTHESKGGGSNEDDYGFGINAFPSSVHSTSDFHDAQQRQQLQHQQPEELHNDLRSSSTCCPSSWRLNNFEMLFAETVEQIPLHEKHGYIYALTNCSIEVRNSEANPYVFFRYEKNNIWSAARRLVKFWEWRILLFGETLACRQLLDEQDKQMDRQPQQQGQATFVSDGFRQLIEDQIYFVLPHKDCDGNFVVVYDRSRCETEQKNVYDELRALFYMLTTLIEHTAASDSSGSKKQSLFTEDPPRFVLLLVKDSQHLPVNTTVLQMPQNVRDMMLEAIPFEIVRIHAIFFSSKPITTAQQSFRMNLPTMTDILLLLRQFFEPIALIVPHVGHERHDIAKQLLGFGMTYEMLPLSLGGTFVYPPRRQRTILTTDKGTVLDPNPIVATTTATISTDPTTGASSRVQGHPENSSTTCWNFDPTLDYTHPSEKRHIFDQYGCNDEMDRIVRQKMDKNNESNVGLDHGEVQTMTTATTTLQDNTSSSMTLQPPDEVKFETEDDVNEILNELYRLNQRHDQSTTATDGDVCHAQSGSIIAISNSSHEGNNNIVASSSSSSSSSLGQHRSLKAYWDLRKELFNERSMYTLKDRTTGNGALSRLDIGTLKTNFIRIVPSTTKIGHLLMIVDLRKSQHRTKLSQRRCFFYFLDSILLDRYRSLMDINETTINVSNETNSNDNDVSLLSSQHDDVQLTEHDVQQTMVVGSIDGDNDDKMLNVASSHQPPASTCTTATSSGLSVLPHITVLVFVGTNNENSIVNENLTTNDSVSFADIQKSFPFIQWVMVHAVLLHSNSSSAMGWISYLEWARMEVSRILHIRNENHNDDNNEKNTTPSTVGDPSNNRAATNLQIHTADFSRSKRLARLISNNGMFHAKTIAKALLGT